MNHEQNPIAYAARSAGRAFDPHVGEAAIRRAIQIGELTYHRVGNRNYVLRDDLIAWVRKGKTNGS
jgi:hypothetical protein